jgi:hypothetical protein
MLNRGWAREGQALCKIDAKKKKEKKEKGNEK